MNDNLDLLGLNENDVIILVLNVETYKSKGEHFFAPILRYEYYTINDFLSNIKNFNASHYLC